MEAADGNSDGRHTRSMTPQEGIAVWKREFGTFWPEKARFYAPFTEIAPGEVGLINNDVPGGQVLSTGVMVIYADDESFTFMTPEGHIFAAWITFSAERDDQGGTVAQVQALIGASDPLSEALLMAEGHGQEDRHWEATLSNLASRFGATGTPTTDPGPRGRQTAVAPGQEHPPQLGHPLRPMDDDPPATHVPPHQGVAGAAYAPALVHDGAVSSSDTVLDAIVVGSGPNGLAAAITLARAGLGVRVYEAADKPGGGTRSAELTLPGFVHDVCSTVVATALVSPFFETIDLAARGAEYVHPEVPAGHALDDRAVLLFRDVEATADGLGRDGRAYRRLMGPLVRDAAAGRLLPAILGPLVRVPRHPLAMARFGIPALASTTALARLAFRDEPARALLAGLSAHAMVPLREPATASFGLVLALAAHLVGWPVVRGGTQHFADALVAELRSLGGEVVTGTRVTSLDELPKARTTLLDLTPRDISSIAGDRLPQRYRRKLERFRYGPGVCKVDWALSEPIPWRSSELARVGTVHIGGTVDEVESAERMVHRGGLPKRPFVLLVQATIADPSRAPAGRHTAWAYAHVPNGSPTDVSHRIEAQIERYAPGFRETILGRAVRTAPEMEAYNANYVGGDINGGLQDLPQLLARPTLTRNPYATPVPGLYLCSSSTPPGGGVHGMSGHLAAKSALHREFGISGQAQLS